MSLFFLASFHGRGGRGAVRGKNPKTDGKCKCRKCFFVIKGKHGSPRTDENIFFLYLIVKDFFMGASSRICLLRSKKDGTSLTVSMLTFSNASGGFERGAPYSSTDSGKYPVRSTCGQAWLAPTASARRAAASCAGGPSTEQVQSLERRATELETALQRFGRI